MADALLSIRVTPRSSQNRIACECETIRVWVTAPPTDGQANDAVCRLVAKKLGVAPGRVTVARGETSRDKTLRIEGISLDEVRAKL